MVAVPVRLKLGSCVSEIEMLGGMVRGWDVELNVPVKVAVRGFAEVAVQVPASPRLSV